MSNIPRKKAKERMRCVCSECGALSVEYAAPFNKGLAKCLSILFAVGLPVETGLIKNLKRGEGTNFHKLRYWGLAEQHVTEKTKRKRGCWKITDKGKDFVSGKIKINSHAVTYRNVVIGFEGPEIAFEDVNLGYKYRADWAADARAQILADRPKNNGQQELL